MSSKKIAANVARAADLVADAGLLRQRPQRAGASVDREEADDRVGAELQVCFAGEEQRRHMTRAGGRKGGVINVAGSENGPYVKPGGR